MPLDFLLALLAAPTLLAAGYLLMLTVASGRRPAPLPASARPRFDVVVPAHDEEAGIGRTVESLLALEWPRTRFRVLVVADNCSDTTAARAAAAGATVLERSDMERRGKGYALDFAFQRILAEDRTDAVVVIDADSVASPDLLAAFASRLECGAHAMQASYRVLNPLASWRTRLMTVAFALVNDLRSLGRERLRLSCGLKGNGMCFSAEALRRVPHQAFSIVEDLEYGIHLAEAGLRVHYVWEASVRGEMVAGGAASRSQRERWEGGRSAVRRSHAWALLRSGLVRRDRVRLDLAAELLVPPLARLGAWTSAGALSTAGLAAWGWCSAASVLPWGASVVALLAYLARGVHLSGLGIGAVTALAWAPVYAAWKVAGLRRRRTSEWVRTAREGAPAPDPNRARNPRT